MTKPPKDLLDLLRRYSRGVQELTLALREIVIEELAPCHETILEVYMISLAYASSERVMKDGICYIGVLKERVNLGFHHGASMRNAHGLLEGTGKQMRHIKIRNIEDLMHPGIRDSLREAAERIGHDVNASAKKPVTTPVTTMVKRKGQEKKAAK